MSNEPERMPLGFLQMCIDKRFHRAVQQKFEQVTGLRTDQYWLHADVGGTPGLAKDRPDAADYCYDKLIKATGSGAGHMGWAAHGNKCGGFEGDNDNTILSKLRTEFEQNVTRYPSTSSRPIVHHLFFATAGGIIHNRVPNDPGQ
jgi:hypothetical protein